MSLLGSGCVSLLLAYFPCYEKEGKENTQDGKTPPATCHLTGLLGEKHLGMPLFKRQLCLGPAYLSCESFPLLPQGESLDFPAVAHLGKFHYGATCATWRSTNPGQAFGKEKEGMVDGYILPVAAHLPPTIHFPSLSGELLGVLTFSGGQN